METTTELIDWLRDRADYLETILHDGEITDELKISKNLFGFTYPYLAIKQGFIDLDFPSKEE